MIFLPLTLTIFSFLGHAVSSAIIPDSGPVVCNGKTVVLHQDYIGKDRNVKLAHTACASENNYQYEKRQTNVTNVCGANCATNCFTPSGGGPNPNDCNVIADALLYDSQNIAPLFQIGIGSNNTIAMTYSTCTTFFVNQFFGPLAYCRTDWAALVNFIAFNCQSTQNAHGGNCVATNQDWFVQVQHS